MLLKLNLYKFFQLFDLDLKSKDTVVGKEVNVLIEVFKNVLIKVEIFIKLPKK